MDKSEFKLKDIPGEFGNKDTADIMQGLTGIIWILAIGITIANAFIPGDEWVWWRWVLLAIVIIAVVVLNIFNWTALGNRLSPLYYSRHTLEKFAKMNSLKMFGRRKEKYDEQYYPGIAQLGFRQREEFGCEGVIAGVPITIFAHSYRSKWINYDIGRKWTLVTHITMSGLMPHTVLQTRNNSKGHMATSIARTFDDNQRVSLQNNLDDYFIFYTHRRTVTDALALWSPQLLYKLRELDCQLSIETIGNDIFIYSNSENDQQLDIEQYTKFVEEVTKSVKRSLRTKFLRLPNDNKYPYLRSRPAGGLAIFAGKHFAFGWVILGYFVLHSILRIISEGGTQSEDFGLRVGILLGGIIVAAIFLIRSRSSYTKTKNRRGI